MIAITLLNVRVTATQVVGYGYPLSNQGYRVELTFDLVCLQALHAWTALDRFVSGRATFSILFVSTEASAIYA